MPNLGGSCILQALVETQRGCKPVAVVERRGKWCTAADVAFAIAPADGITTSVCSPIWLITVSLRGIDGTALLLLQQLVLVLRY